MDGFTIEALLRSVGLAADLAAIKAVNEDRTHAEIARAAVREAFVKKIDISGPVWIAVMVCIALVTVIVIEFLVRSKLGTLASWWVLAGA